MIKYFYGFKSTSVIKDSLWTVFKVTAGTAAGTSLTERNLNLSFSDNAPATSFGDAAVTGGLTGNTLAIWHTPANDGEEKKFGGGLRLDEKQELAMTVSASGTIAITILGFFT